MKKLVLNLSIILVLGIATLSNATLLDRGEGLIYDSDLNITWLQDANYAKSSGYNTVGSMNWNEASAFAENASYYDSVRGVTYSDWRLPRGTTSAGTNCGGYNCDTTELGHLYYNELLNGAGRAGFYPNTGPFLNVQNGDPWWSSRYWTDTVLYPSQTSAYFFSFGAGGEVYQGSIGGGMPPLYGYAGADGKTADYIFVWLVRDGDVGAKVPEPTTLLLLGLGLMGLAGVRRKYKK